MPGAYVETERLADKIPPLVRKELFRHYNPRSVPVLYAILAVCIMCIIGQFVRDLDRRTSVNEQLDRQQAWVEVDRGRELVEIRSDIEAIRKQTEFVEEMRRLTAAFEKLNKTLERSQK